MSRSGGLLLLLLLVGAAWGLTLDLNGQWQVANANGSISVPATVPGQIHTDLLAARKIPDPYYRFNDVELQWVAAENWSYSRTFTVTSDLLAFSEVYLVTEGLDTVAEVTINKVVVLRSANMFRTFRTPVKHALQAGTNSITVAFTSALTYSAQQFAEYPMPPGGGGIPPNCPPDVQNGFCHVNFIRKEPCSFSWDWGPAYAPQGIWRDIYLEAFSPVVVREILTATAPEGSDWNLAVSAYISASVAGSVPVSVTVYTLDGKVIATQSTHANLRVGEELFDQTLVVKGVQPWWPNGLGAPNLYKLTFQAGNASNTVRFGFRTVKLVQEPVGNQPGLSFYFAVNGVPVFIKGANWIPADSFESRVTRDSLSNLFDSYVDSNFNTLRVWGGGIYQSDDFYDLADERGILIWQEFIFACALYPTNADFLDNIAQEVRDNVRRLQHHPSIILWSGNNENEAAIAQNWYGLPGAPYRQQYVEMYSQLYFQTVLNNVSAIDITRPLLSSSPSNGDETAADPVASDPQDQTRGDVHYYNYLADCWNVSLYPRPRFASEFGFESFPSHISMAAVSNQSAGDWKYSSQFMLHRQHHGDGNDQIFKQMALHFKLPPGAEVGTADSFAKTLFMTQVVHGMCIKTEAEHYRRARDQSANGYTMGSLYWQANDIWQGASWSSIEYGGRWKVLQYYAKDFYAPVLVSAWRINDEFGVYVVNDRPETSVQGTITFTVWHYAAGTAPTTWIAPFAVGPNDAKQAYSTTVSAIASRAGCSTAGSCVLIYEAADAGGNVLSSNFFFLDSLTQAPLADPQLRITAVTLQGGSTFKITFDGKAVAPFVWLETPIPGRFSRNGHVYVPNGPETVTFNSWDSSVTADKLQQSLAIWSLYSVYQ